MFLSSPKYILNCFYLFLKLNPSVSLLTTFSNLISLFLWLSLSLS